MSSPQSGLKPVKTSKAQKPQMKNEETYLHGLNKMHKWMVGVDQQKDILTPKMSQTLKIMSDSLVVKYQLAADEMMNEAERFLHAVKDKEHDKDQVQKIIRLFPAALRYKDEFGEIPIQSAIYRDADAIAFIPLFAQERINHLRTTGVEDDVERGGILSLMQDGRTLLEWISTLFRSSDEHPEKRDARFVDLLTELRVLGLLKKKDIVELNLLASSNTSRSEKRFNFFVDWFPEALNTRVQSKNLPIHESFVLKDDANENNTIAHFQRSLQTGMKQYPDCFGFLFRKDSNGNTAFQLAIEKYEKKKVFRCIQECIPPSDNHPILHIVIRHAIKYFSEFLVHYPESIFLKDKMGRLPLHVALSNDKKFSAKLIVMMNTPAGAEGEKDPKTGLLPFMSAAVLVGKVWITWTQSINY